MFVHFERPTKSGFDSARYELSEHKWTERKGYTDDEITMFEQMLYNDEKLLFKRAENAKK